MFKLTVHTLLDLSGFLSDLSTSLRSGDAVQITSKNNGGREHATAAIDQTISAYLGDDPVVAQILFLGSFLVVLLIFIFLYGRFRARRQRMLDAENPADSQDEQELFNVVNEEELASFSPSYISTEMAPTILVAEADDELRLFITNTLRLNYRVIAVADGLKAFRKAYDIIPDLVITNSRIPGMDGISLCHALKSTMATSHMQVILLNKGGEQSAAPEDMLPADGCLKADFDAKTLLIEVRNIIAYRKNIYTAFRKQLTSGQPMEEYFASEMAFMTKVNTVLRNRYHESNFNVDDLADGLSMTKIQLFRKLKALTNKTPGDYIRYFRVREAKRLLNSENRRISEVAQAVGFSSLTSFAKAFKEVTGISPLEFAEQPSSFS